MKNGKGLPDPGDGTAGDFYVDITNGRMYLKHPDGAWVRTATETDTAIALLKERGIIPANYDPETHILIEGERGKVNRLQSVAIKDIHL